MGIGIGIGGTGNTVTPWKLPARASTTAALPACALVGNRLTAVGVGALPAQDAVNLIVNDVLLVRHQGGGASHLQNGPYRVTDVGGVGTPWILDRAPGCDISGLVYDGMIVSVQEGTLAGHMFQQTTNNPITLNVTALAFVDEGTLMALVTQTTSGTVNATGAVAGAVCTAGAPTVGSVWDPHVTIDPVTGKLTTPGSITLLPLGGGADDLPQLVLAEASGKIAWLAPGTYNFAGTAYVTARTVRALHAVGTAQTIGAMIVNPTAATNGVQQYSACSGLEAEAWDVTAVATAAVRTLTQCRGVQGAAVAQAQFDVYTGKVGSETLKFSAGGQQILFPTTIPVQLGAAPGVPGAAGGIGLTDTQHIVAGAGNYALIGLEGTTCWVGGPYPTRPVHEICDPSTDFLIAIGGTPKVTTTATGTACVDPVTIGAAGSLPAAGTIGLPSAFTFVVKSSTGEAQFLTVDATDDIHLGSNDADLDDMWFDVATGQVVNVTVAGVTILTIAGSIITAAKPIAKPSYTVAQLLAGTPSAIPAGQQCYASDAAGGGCMVYSRGGAAGDWRRFDTNDVVA